MLGDKILQTCKQKGVTLRAACQAAGLKYSTLHAQISNRRAIPFSTIDRLARALDLPLSHFSESRPLFQFTPDKDGTPPSAQVKLLERSVNLHTGEMASQGLNITIDAVLDWLVNENFRLTNFDWLKDRVDLYHPIETDAIMARPYHVGDNSLSSRMLGFSPDTDLEDYFKNLEPNLLDEIRLSYAAVAPQHYTVTDQNFRSETGSTIITGRYRKLMAGVTDVDGSPFTLVFCRIIHASKKQ